MVVRVHYVLRPHTRGRTEKPLLGRAFAIRCGQRLAAAATLQRPLLAVRFAVELRLDAPRFAAELRFAAGFAGPPELRSFCSRSRSRSTALFIFSRSRRASRRSLATSLRRSLPPVRTLPRIAPSSFSVASSAVLMRAIARPFCSKRARAAALTRAPAAGFLAAAVRDDDALRVVVFRALAFLVGGIDAPCVGTTGRSVAELLTIRGARREDGRRYVDSAARPAPQDRPMGKAVVSGSSPGLGSSQHPLTSLV